MSMFWRRESRPCGLFSFVGWWVAVRGWGGGGGGGVGRRSTEVGMGGGLMHRRRTYLVGPVHLALEHQQVVVCDGWWGRGGMYVWTCQLSVSVRPSNPHDPSQPTHK